MQNTDVLDAFGHFLMRNVRDFAISQTDKMVNGEIKGAAAQQVADVFARLPDEYHNTVNSLISLTVDHTLAALLWGSSKQINLLYLPCR